MKLIAEEGGELTAEFMLVSCCRGLRTRPGHTHLPLPAVVPGAAAEGQASKAAGGSPTGRPRSGSGHGLQGPKTPTCNPGGATVLLCDFHQGTLPLEALTVLFTHKNKNNSAPSNQSGDHMIQHNSPVLATERSKGRLSHRSWAVIVTHTLVFHDSVGKKNAKYCTDNFLYNLNSLHVVILSLGCNGLNEIC